MLEIIIVTLCGFATGFIVKPAARDFAHKKVHYDNYGLLLIPPLLSAIADCIFPGTFYYCLYAGVASALLVVMRKVIQHCGNNKIDSYGIRYIKFLFRYMLLIACFCVTRFLIMLLIN